MGDVVDVTFGQEREWEKTHAKTRTGLVTIGKLFGDDEQLMLNKADCVYHMLRAIMEEVPTVQWAHDLPDNLTETQLAIVRDAVKTAACKGIETAIMHSVEVISHRIYDLCTSKLASMPEDHEG